MQFDNYGLVSDEWAREINYQTDTINILIKRIEALEKYISYLHEIILINLQELEEAKKRMLSLFEDNRTSVEANARMRKTPAKEHPNDKLD